MSEREIPGKLHSMRATVALVTTIAALSLTLADKSALAQDVAPETPPELRDFRLDPQPVQPTVEPAPVTPPPAVSTAPDSQPTAPRAQTLASVPRRTSEPAASLVASKALTGDPSVVPPVVNTAPVAVDDPALEVAEPQPEAVSPSFSANWWLVAGGLGLIGMILIAALLFRRSRNRALQYDSVDEPAAEPPKAYIPAKATAKPLRPFAPSVSTSKPRIIIDFIPEKASVSFTALTIKGELRIINQSDGPAKNMQLRAALISASAHQETEIAGFYNAALDTQAKNLGDAQAGERIGMGIELSVPLADLQSFPLGDQQLFVPIMVGNIAYGNDDGTLAETAKIACMIGREANPPKPKMAPLRLDLGPRSFSPLGQRPLLT